MSDDTTVGVVTTPDLSHYSPERINYTICSILTEDHAVTLVGPERVTKRIKNSFEIYTPIRRTYGGKLIRRVLLFPLTLLTVWLYARREQPEVLAAFGNLGINGYCCALISSVTESTSVVRVTSDHFAIWKYGETRTERIVSYIHHNVFGRLALRLADRVIVLGPVMQGKLKAKGIPAKRIEPIPQPVAFPNAVAKKEDGDKEQPNIREKFNVPDHHKIVLFVGYFSREKGPERLVRTVQKLLDHDEQVSVLLVGSGGAHERWVRDELNMSRVIFPGWINHEDLPAYYAGSDVLYLPSNSEGLPNVILEALAFDLPIVATDSGGEVPVYVSNIGRDDEDLVNLLLSPDELILDPFPREAHPERNRRRYRELFQACIS